MLHSSSISEAGFAANKRHRLGEIIVGPGYSDERIHLFVARGLREAPQNLDGDKIFPVLMCTTGF